MSNLLDFAATVRPTMPHLSEEEREAIGQAYYAGNRIEIEARRQRMRKSNLVMAEQWKAEKAEIELHGRKFA